MLFLKLLLCARNNFLDLKGQSREICIIFVDYLCRETFPVKVLANYCLLINAVRFKGDKCVEGGWVGRQGEVEGGREGWREAGRMEAGKFGGMEEGSETWREVERGEGSRRSRGRKRMVEGGLVL
jgi:hypothetical protein